MRPRHGAVWAGFTVAALTATSACGTEVAEDGTARIAAVLARASDRTQQLGSAEMATTTEFEALGGRPITVKGTYSWDGGAAMDVEMDTTAARMTRLQDDPTTRVILVDGAYYYNIDPQPRGPLEGKHWMRIEASAVVGDNAARNMDTQADPTVSLRSLRAATDVEDLGEETVLGKKTHHYRGTIGEAEINAGDKLDEADKRLAVEALETSGGKMVCDLWVDGKDLPVRIRQDGAGATVTTDFLTYGSATPISAPPSADTGDLTEQVRQLREQTPQR
ncbi:DUF4412 domain-containing protein [Streptomyces sp. XM83C]|jgi:hypothetical protein|uniref:DUF4412 domain-containing protein n=1 Tax=Streptomyces thermocoprophilus TaxID=78356 RepID=A0ABV5V975_9ACTN|nr:DUF4412 domain-containing protein [Streptomyces sp. XM83C]MCK1820685.1 DUF4412 domain-containing protein [Streptomyces sp. XM83C]